MNIKNIFNQVAIVVFGVVFPVYVLFQAFHGVSTLRDNVSYDKTVSQLVNDFADARKNITEANDYALFSLMYVEHANQKTMINKQVMKAVIVHIGFAVISIGMMLIILGINDGGLEGSAGSDTFKFDFKTGSTGVAVFVIGALMSTAGGVLKNDYKTSEIPKYEHSENEQYAKSINAYKSCYKKSPNPPEQCFVSLFEQINKDYLK